MNGEVFSFQCIYLHDEYHFIASWLCRYLGQEVFLHYEDKGLIKVGVEICVLNRSFLLLPDSLSFRVEELYLDVGIRGAGDVHLLQLLTLQNSDGELQNKIINK